MRAEVLFALVLSGCASAHPRWVVRSDDGIPRDAEIWVTPAGGVDARTMAAFDARIVSELVHDGARVRNDEAPPGEWRVEVVVDEVVPCDDGAWFPRRSASAKARVTILHDERVSDRFVAEGVVGCHGMGAEPSKTRAGRQLAVSVGTVIKARRHVW